MYTYVRAIAFVGRQTFSSENSKKNRFRVKPHIEEVKAHV